MRSWALAVLAILAMPPALGQQAPSTPLSQTALQVKIAPTEQPAEPLGQPIALPIEVAYTYEDYAPQGETVEVTLAIVQAPPWATATLNTPTVALMIGGAPCFCVHTVVGHAMLLLGATADAPAFTFSTITVAAKTQPTTFHDAASPATIDVPFIAGFKALTDVKTPADVTLRPSTDAIAVLAVANAGNGLVRISFDLVSAPSGLEVRLPQPITLEARQQGGKVAAKAVPLQLDGGDALESGDVVIDVHTAYALDTSIRGPDKRVSFHVTRDQAAGGTVTTESILGPEPATTLLPLGAGAGLCAIVLTLALAARRRRRRIT